MLLMHSCRFSSFGLRQMIRCIRELPLLKQLLRRWVSLESLYGMCKVAAGEVECLLTELFLDLTLTEEISTVDLDGLFSSLCAGFLFFKA